MKYTNYLKTADARVEALRHTALSLSLDVATISKVVLDDPKFATWTGSTGGKHHDGAGGLAQHTWEVVELCLKSAGFFNILFGREVDLEELFLSALFHDVGKLDDYRPVDSISEKGTRWEGTWHKRHIYHIPKSALVWSKAVDATGLFKKIHDNVLHAILSHHGQREWGSNVLPGTEVAWILHLCDGMSARTDEVSRNCDPLKLFT